MMKKAIHILTRLLPVAILLGVTACSSETEKAESSLPGTEALSAEAVYPKDSFGYDAQLLQKHQKVVLLKDKDSKACVLVCPAYQGRVMTSSTSGLTGKSLGWMNHSLIASGKVQEHINVYGGEDRFWLGPEGGQFSIFFKKDVPFEFKHWFTPKEIDTEPFEMTSQTSQKVSFEKDMALINYSGFQFKLKVNRDVDLISREKAAGSLGTAVSNDINFVGYQTTNKITNTGDAPWTKKTGALSIWILGMFPPSPSTVAVIPFKAGDTKILGPIVKDDYFGKVPAERLKVTKETIFFKADGALRSKIGVPPLRSKPFCGSYDQKNQLLTIVGYSIHEKNQDYVNSLWKLQKEPYRGDLVNSYNDGPLEDGSQLGPFYELESSSPAAFLAPGEAMTHVHSTYHFQGDEAGLSKISEKVLGVSLAEVKTVFKP